MRIISIAFKDTIVMLKDKKALALIVLMPIILILVLGVCLSFIFNQSSGINIKAFDIAVADNDGGDHAKHFKDFLNSEDIKKIINVNEMSENQAMDKVKAGDMPALIVIPAGYSNLVDNSKRAEIQIYIDPGSQLESRIVESIVKSYTGVGSTLSGAVDAAVAIFREYNADVRMVIQQIAQAAEDKNIDFNESNVERTKTLSSIQYYSAAILVMFILFVAMLGTTSIIYEREQKTLMRLMSTTVSKTQILTGKVLGLLILGIFDVSVLILVTRFIFNVSWGSNIEALIILSLSMIFAASGFSMLIASIFKTSKAVFAVNPAIVMVMSFLGGSMFPIMAMPPVMQNIAKITMNGWALRGYLSLMLGGGMNVITIPSIVLCIMGIVFLSAGILRLKLE